MRYQLVIQIQANCPVDFDNLILFEEALLGRNLAIRLQ
jgi:hypothetical protein